MTRHCLNSPIVIDSRKRQGDLGVERDGAEAEGGPSSSLFTERKRGRPKKDSSAPPKRPTMSRAQLHEREAQKDKESETYFRACDNLVDAMRRGESDAENAWLINAERLLEMFRKTRPLFPASSVRA